MTAVRYSSRRHELLLSEIEVEALRDMLDDISEYVTDEMFSSPRGLGAFKRIKDKVETLHKKTGRGATQDIE